MKREDEGVPMWIQAIEAELKYKAERHRLFHDCLWGLIYAFCLAWICGLAYGIGLLLNWIG